MSKSSDARVQRKKALVRRIESNDPIRRRILDLLAQGPDRPGNIAQAIGSTRPLVSRSLAALSKEGLVSYRQLPDDRRQREYSLTIDGSISLREHRAFGELEKPAALPDNDALVAFLSASLAEAILLRRRANELAEAIGRMELILAQAIALNAVPLAVNALFELGITYRQAGRFDDEQSLTERLERIGLGLDTDFTADAAIPATAHCEYARGRTRCREASQLTAANEHLTTAARLYSEAAEHRVFGESAKWRERQAWSFVSKSSVYRQGGSYVRSLLNAHRGQLIFEELDDKYGLSRCLFMKGYVSRLMGDFETAWTFLTASRDLAVTHEFERFHADTLMQMGQVARHRKDLKNASGLLDEAVERASKLNLGLTLAFGQSARGATHFDAGEFHLADVAMKKAEATFIQCDHLEGKALNERRRAVVMGRAPQEEVSSEVGPTELLLSASRIYSALGCRAGVIACDVERARSGWVRGNLDGDLVSAIVSRSLDNRFVDLVAADPWTPQLVVQLVEDLDDEAPPTASKSVESLKEATRRERTREHVRLAEFGFATTDVRSFSQPAPDEMAGESRCHTTLLGTTNDPEKAPNVDARASLPLAA